MGDTLDIESLEQALLEAGKPSVAGIGTVTVKKVRVGQAAALLAVLNQSYGHCAFSNLGRLSRLASVDGFLRAILVCLRLPDISRGGARIKPVVLDRLDDYVTYVKYTAAEVGGTFQPYADLLYNDIMRNVQIARNHQVRRARKRPLHRNKIMEMCRSVLLFRSRDFTISTSEDDLQPNFVGGGGGGGGDNDNDDQVNAKELSVGSLTEMVTAVMDKFAVEERLTIASVRVDDSSVMLCFIAFHACNGVSNLRRLRALSGIDNLLEAISEGLLSQIRVADHSEQALRLLGIYARSVEIKAAKVGGNFEEHAYNLCDRLVSHSTKPLTDAEATYRLLRQSLVEFRSRLLTLYSV